MLACMESPVIVRREAFRLAGVRLRTSNSDPDAIAAHWRRALSAGLPTCVAGRASDDVVCVYADYESDHRGPYTMWLGAELAPGAAALERLETLEVPGASFTEFEAAGPQPAGVVAAWTAIWGMPRERLTRAFRADVERWTPRAMRGDEPVRISVSVVR
jgi:predicted transcriptional regulator YdeE